MNPGMTGRLSPDNLKSITRQELQEILNAHQDYVERRPGGRRASFLFHDLSDKILSNYALVEADFTGARLHRARLENCDLRLANFFGADLSVATLTGSDLTRADLRGACLRGAELTGARFVEADLREGMLAWQDPSKGYKTVEYWAVDGEMTAAVAEGADFSHAKIGGKVAMKTNFSDAILRHTDFKNSDLRNANFSGAQMEGAILSGARLIGADLSGTDLTGVQFTDADLCNVNLDGAILDPEALEQPELKRVEKPRRFEVDRSRLWHLVGDHGLWVESAGQRGARADLSYAALNDEDLKSANLAAAEMYRCIAVGLVLDSANLVMTNLSGADLRRASLQRADMRGVNLERATLYGANLAGADLSPLASDRSAGRQWPANLRWARFRGANLAGAVLRDADLIGADLEGADLSGADLSGARLQSANLTDANLADARLQGVKVGNTRGLRKAG
ncbi:MAG TPA: pentapeptide repeat-containing protein [Alphaproteobacteria bacterium]|nr:pentapeptide repeat-containing protein [Alphaproteobacteria bacterium]